MYVENMNICTRTCTCNTRTRTHKDVDGDGDESEQGTLRVKLRRSAGVSKIGANPSSNMSARQAPTPPSISSTYSSTKPSTHLNYHPPLPFTLLAPHSIKLCKGVLLQTVATLHQSAACVRERGWGRGRWAHTHGYACAYVGTMARQTGMDARLLGVCSVSWEYAPSLGSMLRLLGVCSRVPPPQRLALLCTHHNMAILCVGDKWAGV